MPSTTKQPWLLVAVDAVLARLRLLLAILIACTAGGALLASLGPRPFVAESRLEIGTAFLDTWLTHPLSASARLESLVRTHPDCRGCVAEAKNIRRRGTNELTRFITFRVETNSATTAETLRRTAIKAWLAEEKIGFDRERDALVAQENAFLNLQDKLQDLETQTSTVPAALASAHLTRLLVGTRSTSSEARLFPARVLTDRELVQMPRRTLIGGLAGALLGLLLSVALLLFGPAERDPVVSTFGALSLRYAPLIGCVVTVMTAGCLAYVMGQPQPWRAVSVLEPAVTSNGSLAEVDALTEDLGRSFFAAYDNRALRLGIRVVRDQPPQNNQVNLLEVSVEHPDRTTAQQGAHWILRELERRQQPMVDAERLHLSKDRKMVDFSLRQLEDTPFDPWLVKTWADLIIERARLERNLSRTRAPIERQPPVLGLKERNVAGFVMGGLGSGLLVGYALAFVFAAVRARSRRER